MSTNCCGRLLTDEILYQIWRSRKQKIYKLELFELVDATT